MVHEVPAVVRELYRSLDLRPQNVECDHISWDTFQRVIECQSQPTEVSVTSRLGGTKLYRDTDGEVYVARA